MGESGTKMQSETGSTINVAVSRSEALPHLERDTLSRSHTTQLPGTAETKHLGLSEMGRAHSAQADAEAILAEDPKNLAALELLAKSLWTLGEYRRVIAVVKRLLRINSFEPGYLLLRAYALWGLGLTGDATRDLIRARSGSSDVLFLLKVDAVIDAIDAYQAELIRDLLRLDARFAREYERDPIQASKKRGFEFSWHSAPHELDNCQPRREDEVRPSVVS